VRSLASENVTPLRESVMRVSPEPEPEPEGDVSQNNVLNFMALQ
jgi:hypothetical protein